MIDRALQDLDDTKASALLRDRLAAAPRRATLEAKLAALETLDDLEPPRSVRAMVEVLRIFK